MSDRPHVLILMTDQQRGDGMSCAGHPVVRTPNMDRIAGEGTRFWNACTSSPVCMPARSSFLTGLFCHNHGQWTNVGRLPPTADTFARRLRDAGYRTCHVGKSHYYPHVAGDHLDNHRWYVDALGWSDVFETTGPLATRRTDSLLTDRWRELGCLDAFRDDYAKRAEVGSPRATWPSPLPDGEHMDDIVGRTAVEYVEAYDDESPMCLFVGFGGPHKPWDPPRDWAAKYDPADMDPALPVDEPPDWLTAAAATAQRSLQDADAAPTGEQIARMKALYYAKISHIDSWFGRIIDALAARGMWDDTAVVFWSDHGEMLGDKGRLAKGVFYEGAVKVPLIVRAPGGAGGRVCDAPVSLVDAPATILDLAGCDASGCGFGRSLAPLTDDPTAAHHDAVFSEFANGTMVFDGRHKLVVDDAGRSLLLFDLVTDPDEKVNLVGRTDARAIEAALRERMFEWLLATPNRQAGHALPEADRSI